MIDTGSIEETTDKGQDSKLKVNIKKDGVEVHRSNSEEKEETSSSDCLAESLYSSKSKVEKSGKNNISIFICLNIINSEILVWIHPFDHGSLYVCKTAHKKSLRK